MNLAKTASVKSVTTDTKILDAKKVETAELLVDGVSISEVVPKWKPREHIYRCTLEEDDDYIIYDDEGNFLDCKLDTLENGTDLFQGTKGVEEFSFSLPNLTNGSNMFTDCNLGEKAVESILRTIPEYSEGSHPLTMNMGQDAFEKFNEITGNTLETAGTISYKGWDITSNAVLVLPTGYRRVEYLDSSSSRTQWIDTAYRPNKETGLLLDSEMTASSDTIPFGCRNDNSTDSRFYALRPARAGQSHGYGWGRWMELSRLVDTGRLLTKTNWMSSGIVESESSFSVLEPLLFEPSETLFLFAANIANQPSLGWSGTIYSAAISQGSEIVHNFVPCIDNLGNPCMYDTVTKESFLNQGSETFLTSESSSTYSLRQPVPTYAKMTAHGIQKLYHLPEGYDGSEDVYAQENGFKLLTENERPEEGNWRPKWVETDNELILNWIEVEEEELTNV